MGPLDPSRLVAAIRTALADVHAIYLFGSVARGDDSPSSDLDLAVLAPRALSPIARWELQETLATLARRDVDLVDLRAATTVMCAEVYRSDRLLYEGDRRAREWFEALALASYARLNEERRGILEDAAARGTVLS